MWYFGQCFSQMVWHRERHGFGSCVATHSYQFWCLKWLLSPSNYLIVGQPFESESMESFFQKDIVCSLKFSLNWMHSRGMGRRIDPFIYSYTTNLYCDTSSIRANGGQCKLKLKIAFIYWRCVPSIRCDITGPSSVSNNCILFNLNSTHFPKNFF